MANYSFLKEAEVYLDYGSVLNRIDISSVSFSQTIAEESYSVKTIQNQAMFEGSIINKANPANFEITIPALREDDNKKVFDRLLDYNSFDLYIQTEHDIFKLETSVITNGTFLIDRLKPLSLTVSGEASQLSTVASLPRSVADRSATRTYNKSIVQITLNGADISSDLSNASLEIQNNVSWIPWLTMQNSNSIMYPLQYTINDRIVAGNINRYLNSDNDALLQTISTSATLLIKVGETVSSTFYGFQFNSSSCSYTNRLQTGAAFTQNYDWRMLQNPTSLSDVITYTTI